MKELYIDASLLKESDCSLKFHRIHNLGLTTKLNTWKMDYGTAGHKFIHGLFSGLSLADAKTRSFQYFMPKCLAVPDNDWRTIDHLVMTLDAYYNKYPPEYELVKPLRLHDGSLGLEMPFIKPLEMFFDLDSHKEFYELLDKFGIRILLTGTIDLLGDYLNQQIIMDHKFTALWDKEKFFNGFRLGVQPMFYSWVIRKLGISSSWLPMIINGVFIKNPTLRSKDKVTGRLVPNTGWTGATFERSNPIGFHDEQMELFEDWLLDRLTMIVTITRPKPDFTQCEKVYGPCAFTDLCLARKDKQELYLSNYEQRDYRPWEFQE